jgi:hypothetical protein
MSATHSPPPATISATWGEQPASVVRRSPLAGPRHGGRKRRRDPDTVGEMTEKVQPHLRGDLAVALHHLNPSTALVAFTSRVPSWSGLCSLQQRQNPFPRGHLRGRSGFSDHPLVKDQG